MTQPVDPRRGGWQAPPPPGQPWPGSSPQPGMPPGPPPGTPPWTNQQHDPRNVAPGSDPWRDSLRGQPPSWVGQQPSPPQAPNPWHPRDPQRPLGQQNHAHVSIDSFSQPKPKAPFVVVALIAMIVLALAIGAYQASRPKTGQATPTPSSSAPRTPQVTANPNANSVPFHSEDDDADGEWEIVKSTWTNAGLEVTVRLKVTKGTLNYSFFALDNDTTQDYDANPGGSSDITRGSIDEGQTLEGVIVFDKPRGDTTIYLANGRGRQITALVAKG